MIQQPAKTIGIAAGITAGLVGLSAATWTAIARKSLPQQAGTLAIPGLGNPVEVLRDQWGIPHIYAKNNADLFFTQGYIHAQDRLWQMELQRRTGHGQLAEVFGEVALESDRFLRTLGLGRVARQEAATMAGEEKEAVTAYCAGVNQFLATNRRLPLEFTILRYQPRQWEPADIYVFGKVMALNLSMNWTLEVIRAQIIDAIGPARATALDPTYAREHPITIPRAIDYHAALSTDPLAGPTALDAFSGGRDGSQGSNAWVVNGTRTKSGGPLLANDPHLALQLPALWYENHLVGGDYNVIGASIPGTVGVVIGHNAQIAWGVTNGMTDAQDLYIERFDPQDSTGKRYQVSDGWAEATLIDEVISVREKPLRPQQRHERYPVRVTHHGPIVSALVGTPTAGNRHPEEAFALRWTALEADGLQRAILAINRATDWSSFQQALTTWVAPTQNFVYADRTGQIGYHLAGALPQRAQGDGRVPVPGWTGEWEWRECLSPDQNPHALNPASGYIVTANNQIVGDEYPHQIPGEWLPGYRAARIRDELTAVANHDVDSFARLQCDQTSLPGKTLRELARAGSLPVSPDDPFATLVRDMLANWNGILSADSSGGLIATTLGEQLVARTYREIAQPLTTITGLGLFSSLPGSIYLQRSLPRVLALFTGGDTGWLAADDTPAQILNDSWQATLITLRTRWGDQPRRWRYGKTHQLTLRHPLSAIKPLRRIFNRGPYAMGGDLNTVWMGNATTGPTGIESYTAPSYRQICDPTDWDNSCSSYPGGQSGHPASRHYDDLLPAWLAGTYHPTLFTRTAVTAATASRLILTPE